VLAGADLKDFPAGVVAVFAATWTSLRLLPPGWRLRLTAMATLGLRFVAQSAIGGVDVGWRAFHPRLPLRPGFVVYPVRQPPGPGRNAFCAFTSQVPGTIPVGPGPDGGLVIHCLDAGQPVVAHLAEEEAIVVGALGLVDIHG